MPARLTLYPPRRVPRFLVLRDGESLKIGRDPGCDLVLEDGRVSKRHARLRWTGKGWALEDMDSMNGTKVNGERATGAELADGDWVSFGGLFGRFERLTAAQAARLDSERLARIQTSAQMRRRLGADLEPLDLLLRFLELAMEVTAAERGFVLVADPGGRLRPEVAAGFSMSDLWDEQFRGSVGAVREALATGAPVVTSHALADPRLGKRPSVVAQGLWSLACLPLCHAGKLLGFIYVDSRRPGHDLTESELESLELLSDHAAAVLARTLLEQGSGPAARPAEGGLISQLRQRLEELLPAVSGS